MSLHRSRAQDRIRLCAGITELLEVLDRVQARLTIGNMHIEIMLLATFIDGDTFEDQVILVVRRDRRWTEDRVLDAVLRHAALDEIDLEVGPARHFDRAAEGDLDVSL